MDSKKFFNEIRLIIREEVNRAIKTQLTEILQPSNKSKTTVTNSRTNSNVQKNKNGHMSLQEMLNETAESMRTVNFTSQDAQNFDRGRLAAMMGYEDMSKVRSVLPTTDIDNNPVLSVPKEVENALNRDYSGLMKVLNNKKK